MRRSPRSGWRRPRPRQGAGLALSIVAPFAAAGMVAGTWWSLLVILVVFFGWSLLILASPDPRGETTGAMSVVIVALVLTVAGPPA